MDAGSCRRSRHTFRAYGLFRFKQGFGGDFTEFIGEMDLVLSPAIYWAVEHGTSVFKELRKKVYLIRNRGK